MEYLPHLLTIATVMLLGCISPGPDFIAVTSNAAVSRGRGVGVAVGTAAGIAIWATLAVMGLGTLLAKAAWLYEVIRLIGAAYLAYLGIKMLLSARQPAQELRLAVSKAGSGPAPRIGLMVSITNPKAAAFFSSFFVTVLPPHPPAWLLAASIAVVVVVALTWFALLALMFSTDRVKAIYDSLRKPIDAVLGVVLIGLGLRLAISK